MTISPTDALILKFYNNDCMARHDIPTSVAVEEATPAQLGRMLKAVEDNNPAQEFEISNDEEKENLVLFLNNKIVEQTKIADNRNRYSQVNVMTADNL